MKRNRFSLLQRSRRAGLGRVLLPRVTGIAQRGAAARWAPPGTWAQRASFPGSPKNTFCTSLGGGRHERVEQQQEAGGGKPSAGSCSTGTKPDAPLLPPPRKEPGTPSNSLPRLYAAFPQTYAIRSRDLCRSQSRAPVLLAAFRALGPAQGLHREGCQPQDPPGGVWGLLRPPLGASPGRDLSLGQGRG